MASTYLTRAFSSSTSTTKATWSFWVKFSAVNTGVSGTGSMLFQARNSASSNNFRTYIRYEENGTLDFICYNATGTKIGEYYTSQKFRDCNAWYHICYSMDTTLNTASDRLKLYVNGVRVTDFYTGSYTAIGQNETVKTTSSVFTDISRNGGTAGYYFNGILSHYILTDGYVYQADTFGSTDSTTGEWKINADPTISNWGSNGFWILKDGNSVTDSSPNSNTFTVGAGTLTKTEDCPSNVFATLNPLDKGLGSAAAVLANGNNTTMASSGLGDYGLRSTLGASSGKYYFEVKVNGGNTQSIGDMDARLVINMNGSSPTAGFYGFQRYSNSSTNLYNNGTFVSQNTAMWGGITAGDIISFAVDLDNSKIFLQKNGTGWKNTSGATGDPVNGTNPTFTIADATKTYGFYCELRNNADNETQMNFGNGYFGTTAVSSAGSNASGNGIFEYDVPTGYTALSTKGLNL